MRNLKWIIFLLVVGLFSSAGIFYFGVKSQDKDRFDTGYFYLSNEIIFESNQLNLNKFKWGGSLNRKGGGKKYRESNTIPKELEELEVDIVNCSGYLASGKATYVGDFDWKVELIPGSVALDVKDKFKQCGSNYSDTEIQNFVVATPSVKNRKFLKTPEISLTELFADLPSNIQYEMNCKRDEKNILSRNQGDIWMDTDGDGKIDYVSVDVTCSAQGMDCKQDYNCSKSLKLIKGEWIEMSFSKPA